MHMTTRRRSHRSLWLPSTSSPANNELAGLPSAANGPSPGNPYCSEAPLDAISAPPLEA